MSNIIKYLSDLILKNIQDILILGGIVLFIITMFKYVSLFAGSLSLSVVLIILGAVLSKIRS